MVRIRRHPTLTLRQKLRHHVPADVGQTEITPLEPIGQVQMVQPEQMENGRVKVIHMNRVLHNIPSDLVGLADDLAPFDPSPGQPEAERKWMMVASSHPGEALTILTQRGSPKL